jgi:hypothetical protein
VRIHEPRYDCAASKIDQARVAAGEPAEICTDADFRDAVRGDRDGLGDVEGGIERDDATTVENQVGAAHEQ